jgi:hypothetical protein
VNKEKYLLEKYGEEISCIKNKLDFLISSIPKNYKNRDIVYFKENKIKSKIGLIRQRQYRSAKKRNTLLFPTRELAVEYNDTYNQNLFPLISTMVDDVLPQTLMDTVANFAEIKDVGLGDTFSFDVGSHEALTITDFLRNDKFDERKYFS